MNIVILTGGITTLTKALSQLMNPHIAPAVMAQRRAL